MNKKYKKGMEDASKAYEAFGKKQEDALNFILEEVRTGRKSLEDALKEIDVKTEDLYDHLQAKEKAKLYTVYTPFDIIELDIPARQLLLGILLKLATDKDPNEQQQNYLRAVKKYLDIKDFPFGVDFHAVENIENLSELKAIYQTILEYLQLQDGDSYDETALQQELLDCFNLNENARRVIAEQVQALYRATGAVGLAEKYGYVPEESPIINEESTEDTTSGTSVIDSFNLKQNENRETSSAKSTDPPQKSQQYRIVERIIDEHLKSETLLYKPIKQFSEGERKTILSQMTFSAQEQVEDMIAIFDACLDPSRLVSDYYCGILFMKDGFYFRKDKIDILQYMRYDEICFVKEKFSTLIVRDRSKEIKMKSISYAQPYVTSLFEELAHVTQN